MTLDICHSLAIECCSRALRSHWYHSTVVVFRIEVRTKLDTEVLSLHFLCVSTNVKLLPTFVFDPQIAQSFMLSELSYVRQKTKVQLSHGQGNVVLDQLGYDFRWLRFAMVFQSTKKCQKFRDNFSLEIF